MISYETQHRKLICNLNILTILHQGSNCENAILYHKLDLK